MNITIHKELSYCDDEETVINELQDIIDEVYFKHPKLEYATRPTMYLAEDIKEECGVNQYDKKCEVCNNEIDRYELIIRNLSETIHWMDDEEFQRNIEHNEKLHDIYCTLNDVTNRLGSIQREEKRINMNKELINDCKDLEYDLRKKYNDLDRLTNLIKTYREVNYLHGDESDSTLNLIQAINLNASELNSLEIYSFVSKVCSGEMFDKLADVLVYCFELARIQGVPVSQVILHKIQKDIENQNKKA